MRDKAKKIANKTINILGSRGFFWFIIVLFVFQALWIAFSFRYSMINDEYYHFGLIQYFSHQWLPWINNQPVNLDQYGALARNPYLLYHYLISFPFRIVDLFTNNLAVQVISMRVINIGLFAGGLVFFEQLFKNMKIQPIFRNITLLFLVLLPVASFVAATVNYDNAVFLLTALFVLVGLKIIQNQKIQWHNYALTVLIGMVGSLMKVAFIPIFVAGFIFLFIRLIKHKNVARDSVQSFRQSSLWLKLIVLLPVIIVGFLFVERFAVNVIQYHSLSPSCEKQISKERCMSNYVELRAEELKESKSGKPAQLPQFTTTWVSTMESGLLVTGANKNGKFGTVMGQPLPIVYMVVFIGSIVSLAAMFYSLDKLRKIPGFWFVIGIIVLYISALFYENVSSYYKYYQPIAIQGRYLLPLLPIIIVFALLGLNYVMRNLCVLKLSILVVVFILYLNGAGITTHIMRSNDSWDWNNQIVRQINDGARDALEPFIKEWWYDRE